MAATASSELPASLDTVIVLEHKLKYKKGSVRQDRTRMNERARGANVSASKDESVSEDGRRGRSLDGAGADAGAGGNSSSSSSSNSSSSPVAAQEQECWTLVVGSTGGRRTGREVGAGCGDSGVR